VITAAQVLSAAQRAQWSVSNGRAEQIATATAPILAAFEPIDGRLDFDSDALSYTAVRDALAREGK
jgi:hypothetical protein